MLKSAVIRRTVALLALASLFTACRAPGGWAAPAPAAVPASVPAAPAPKPAAPAGKDPLALQSPAAVLMDAASGRVLYAKDEHARRSPASITKLMTMLLTYEALRAGRVKPDDPVVTSAEAVSMGGTQIYLEDGETLSLRDMLRAVAIASANDAAVALAEHLGGSHEQFVNLMNEKARELGMNDTQFRNSTGLDADGHFSSAYDIALLSRHLAVYFPEALELTKIYQDKLELPHRRKDKVFALDNRNKLVLFYQGADGLKTGFTGTSGYCLAATARRGETRMVAVIMGAADPKLRQAETIKLLNYGFANYRTVVLAPADKAVAQVKVRRGRQEAVAAVPRAAFGVSIAKGEEGKVQMRVDLQPLEAPVARGAVIGHLVASLDGRELSRMDLVAATAVARATPWSSITGTLNRLFDLGR